jgi:hypothetical protein
MAIPAIAYGQSFKGGIGQMKKPAEETRCEQMAFHDYSKGDARKRYMRIEHYY